MTDQVTPEAQATDATAAPAAAPVAPPPPNDYVEMKEQTFHFKKDKDTEVDDPENLGKKKKVDGKKHPAVKAYLPVPKTSRLVEFLTATTTNDKNEVVAKFPKEKELVEAAIYDVIYNIARGQINEFRGDTPYPDKTVTASVLNYEQLDFTAIANMPKAERGAWAPSDEEVKAWLESYKAVMPAAANKSEVAINNHVLCFTGRLQKQRGAKDILEMFKGMLAIYMSSVTEDVLEDHLPVVEYFANRIDKWVKAEAPITMDML